MRQVLPGEGEILVWFFKPLHMIIENQGGKRPPIPDNIQARRVTCGLGFISIIYYIIYKNLTLIS